MEESRRRRILLSVEPRKISAFTPYHRQPPNIYAISPVFLPAQRIQQNKKHTLIHKRLPTPKRFELLLPKEIDF
jgi:hypothetical protein